MRSRVLVTVTLASVLARALFGIPAEAGHAAAATSRAETAAVVDWNRTALEAAVAAHAVLLDRYPDQQASLDAALARSLGQVPDGPSEASGVTAGRAVAPALEPGWGQVAPT
jgi:hypothetical protein